jgi:peptidoglycan/LPS O-acetylase OafA/YrhL
VERAVSLVLAVILPMFFALSGFLVTGSLARTRLHQFVALRALRLVPALVVEVTLSALILGAFFTALPLRDYLTNPEPGSYFGNIIGLVHFTLPGVFEHNPAPRVINSQLWTIPFELECYLSLVLLSLSAALKDRRAYIALIVLLSLVATAWAFLFDPVSPIGPIPGRALVVSFLVGVSLHLYRDRIPCSPTLGVVAGIMAAVLLQFPNACYIAAFPVAYLAVWLGLMRPPKIPFGDLSYGVYLFHFPIEQSIMHVFPDVGCWWRLTLIALPLTALSAWLSWNLVEQPLLRRKKDVLAAVDRAYAALAHLAHPILAANEIGGSASRTPSRD